MDNVIGYLTIKTKVDTSGFKDALIDAKKVAQEIEDKAGQQLPKGVMDEVEKEVNDANEIIQKFLEKIQEYNEAKKEIGKGGIIFESEVENANRLKQEIIEMIPGIEKITGEKVILPGINDANKKIPDLSKNIKDMGNKITGVIKNIGRMVLSIFGISSAFMLVKNSMNVISQNDKQLKADLDYMKNALAYAIEPIVRAIVNLAKQLMFYIGYVVKAWTGKNIWENANKGLKGANKEAKKLQKTLAGFDEINVLNEQQDAGGAASPSFDLSKAEGKVPEWLDWIADNKDLILSVMEGVALGLLAWKLGLDDINPVGIGVAIVGIYEAVKTLLDYINDPSWENFGNLITWIGVAIAGFGLAIGAWPVALAGALVAIYGIIIKNWDKIKKFIREGLDNMKEWLTEHFGVLGEMLGELLDGFISSIVVFFDNVFKGVKDIVDGIIKIFKGDFKGGLKQALGGVAEILTAPFEAMQTIVIGILNALISGLNFLIRGLNKLKFDVPDWVPVIGGKKWGFDIPEIPKIKLATGGIVDVPKTGVRLGNAIAGENGAEGVLPFENADVMQRVGQEIAKWIPINLNITNELDGRILSQRLQTIKQNNSFSRNGG